MSTFADEVRAIGHEADLHRRRAVLGYLVLGVYVAFAAGYVSLLADPSTRPVFVFAFCLLAMLQGAWAALRSKR